ncbi:hypothetical protein BJV74DRAFT_76861 [Russula compacta]|nr:hypothetical protein BJV74DRAFT_76861 [Russula compacta]
MYDHFHRRGMHTIPHFQLDNWSVDHRFSKNNFSTLRYEFLDADHVFYSSSEAGTNYPSLVVENVHSSHRTVLALDFPDVVPGTTASCHFSIPQNSMPHIRSSGDSTAYFSADLSDRLIVLNIMSYDWGSLSYRKQQQTIHISTKALLSTVRSHPSGESVPWGVWTPGCVRVVPRRRVAHETVTGLHSLCGMRALNEQIVYDRHSRPVICVYDYHRGRIGNALSAQPAKNASSGAGMWANMRRSPSTTRPEPIPSPSVATSYVLPGGEKEMPCLVKEISIPEGLLNGNLMCVLCEHVVVLLELSDKRLGAPIKGVFCHAI